MKFLKDAFDGFTKEKRISVMARATIENSLSAPRLDAIFHENARKKAAKAA